MRNHKQRVIRKPERKPRSVKDGKRSDVGGLGNQVAKLRVKAKESNRALKLANVRVAELEKRLREGAA